MKDTTQPVKQLVRLGTYGKLIRQVSKTLWPELEIDWEHGPEALLNGLIEKSGIDANQLVAEVMKVPVFMEQFMERQQRIEANLEYLVREIEAARIRKDGEPDAGNYNDRNDNDRNVRTISAA